MDDVAKSVHIDDNVINSPSNLLYSIHVYYEVATAEQAALLN